MHRLTINIIPTTTRSIHDFNKYILQILACIDYIIPITIGSIHDFNKYICKNWHSICILLFKFQNRTSRHDMQLFSHTWSQVQLRDRWHLYLFTRNKLEEHYLCIMLWSSQLWGEQHQQTAAMKRKLFTNSQISSDLINDNQQKTKDTTRVAHPKSNTQTCM